jgi:hypothetical protein
MNTLLGITNQKSINMNQDSLYLSNYHKIINEISNTFIRKNADYGNSFEESLNEEGIIASKIRMGDKWLRFKQLSKGVEPQVKDEALRDTLLDLANYAIMTVMWLDNKS